MASEMESCPLCGALPCDWVDNPHTELSRNALQLPAPKSAAVAELVEALQEADAAIKEWFRYLHGGEMRGSYDGKPEREMLRKAGYRAAAILARHQENTHG